MPEDEYTPNSPSGAYPKWAQDQKTDVRVRKSARSAPDESLTANEVDKWSARVDNANSEDSAGNTSESFRPDKPQSLHDSDPPRNRDSGSSIPPWPDTSKEGRKRLENALRESLRKIVVKGVETGVETVTKTERVNKALRGVVDEVRLPKELASYVLSQIEDTRNSLVRTATSEIRSFLEKTDIAGEVQRVLTSLSFEVRTEVRFVPNDAGGGLKPEVRASAAPKRSAD